MKKYWKIIFLILVIGIMATDMVIDSRRSYAAQETQGQHPLDLPSGTAVGELAPDFSGQTLDGKTFRLSDHTGKIVVLNVFATWCGPCRLEMPHLVEGYNQVSNQGVVFIGINLQENPAAVSGFRDEFGVNFPLLLDPNGELTNNLYRPIGLPTTWFIDPQGVVQYVYSGAMTGEVLVRIIEDIQAGRQPNPFG
ncbi:TlpA family protein disulfide reductase [Chloroflexota bacterium]